MLFEMNERSGSRAATVPIKRKDITDSPERGSDIRSLIARKGSLKQFYLEAYRKFLEVMNAAPGTGLSVELGSGAGFIKEVLPEVLATDVIAYDEIDQIVDATHMPFRSGSLKCVFMNSNIHSPLRYWLAGGLKKWTLLPRAFYPTATRLDQFLIRSGGDSAASWM